MKTKILAAHDPMCLSLPWVGMGVGEDQSMDDVFRGVMAAFALDAYRYCWSVLGPDPQAPKSLIAGPGVSGRNRATALRVGQVLTSDQHAVCIVGREGSKDAIVVRAIGECGADDDTVYPVIAGEENGNPRLFDPCEKTRDPESAALRPGLLGLRQRLALWMPTSVVIDDPGREVPCKNPLELVQRLLDTQTPDASLLVAVVRLAATCDLCTPSLLRLPDLLCERGEPAVAAALAVQLHDAVPHIYPPQPVLLAKAGRLAEANEVLERMLAAPGNPATALEVAKTWLEIGDSKRAESALLGVQTEAQTGASGSCQIEINSLLIEILNTDLEATGRELLANHGVFFGDCLRGRRQAGSGDELTKVLA
jgi:hypothetical protein